jgi:hypothetical protein
VNILNKQSRIADKWWSSFGFGCKAINPSLYVTGYEMFQSASDVD